MNIIICYSDVDFHIIVVIRYRLIDVIMMLILIICFGDVIGMDMG
jgi:hypothetical protein